MATDCQRSDDCRSVSEVLRAVVNDVLVLVVKEVMRAVVNKPRGYRTQNVSTAPLDYRFQQALRAKQARLDVTKPCISPVFRDRPDQSDHRNSEAQTMR